MSAALYKTYAHCLTSFAAPWFFGPYGQQLRILAEELYSLDSVRSSHINLVNVKEYRNKLKFIYHFY